MQRSREAIGLRWVALAGLTLTGACSILIDADSRQCNVDSDCLVRGLTGAICVEHVCEAPARMSAGGSGGVGSSSDPSSALPDAGAVPMTPRDPPDAGTVRPGAAAGASGSSEVDGGSVASGSAGASAGAGGRAADGTRTVGCEATGCIECVADEDCEQLGISGAVCADSICWPPPPECSSDEECAARGPEYEDGRCVASKCRPNPRWRCELPPPAEPGGTKQLTVLVRDSLSLNPVVGVRILACSKLDLTCSAPVAEAKTPMDGNLVITVPANFAGYLQQTDRPEYSPAMYFLPTAFPEDGVLQPFPLLGAGVIVDALALALGAGIDDTRGHMMLISEDCFGMALPGVSFASPQRDDKTVQFYVRDLLPSTRATETAEIGNGGFLNFPTGTPVLNLKQVESGLELATVSVVVRAGFISVAYIRPQPR